METKKITVCIFTNQTIILEGIVSLLGNQEHLKVWTAKRTDLNPDFFTKKVFLETDFIITVFNSEKIELLQQYKDVFKPKKIIAYCDQLNLETLERINHYKIDHTISSTCTFNQLLVLLNTTEIDEKKVRIQTRKKKINQLLSKREQEIVKFIKEGFQIKEISDNLQLSNRTIGKHRENIYKKLNVHSVVELLAKVKVLK